MHIESWLGWKCFAFRNRIQERRLSLPSEQWTRLSFVSDASRSISSHPLIGREADYSVEEAEIVKMATELDTPFLQTTVYDSTPTTAGIIARDHLRHWVTGQWSLVSPSTALNGQKTNSILTS
jgi:hypothetical protein